MSARGLTPATRVALALSAVLIAVGISGCQFKLLPSSPAASTVLRLPGRPPSALVVLLGSALSQYERAEFRQLLAGTARTGERLIVISAVSGATLGSFQAPPPPWMRAPALPPRPRRPATAFQHARASENFSHALALRRRDRRELLIRERSELAAWAARSVETTLKAGEQSGSRAPNLANSLTQGAADVSNYEQTSLLFGARQVLVLLGTEAPTPPRLDPSLRGLTIAVANVPTATAAPVWQAGLLQAGASCVIAFTTASDSRLVALVSAGLTKRTCVSDRLARLWYGPAQYRLPRSAGPALRHALRLLTVTYPTTNATIAGYTDNIAVKGGNRALSWRRAEAVLTWLIAHGVAADRLQAVGFGATDPVAPNRPGGQPLNRRVVLILSGSVV